MIGLFKLGVYVAAGVGTYELLRRAGYLEKVGAWLEEQVPQDLKARASELRDRARGHAEDLANQAQDAVRRATNYHDSMNGEDDAVHVSGNGSHAGGQTITGNGRGVPVTTDDYSGTHMSHNVGRGVVR